MNITTLISEIKRFLSVTFAEIGIWFDKNEDVRAYKPKNNGWTINQILEHIGLTSHFLLILIDKGTQKALNNALKMDLEDALKNYEFHKEKLEEIGKHLSFEWIRPEHMEPKGEKTLLEVKEQLFNQLNQCLEALQKLKNGEGILYKTTMTVNNLGKINVYEYIYFLAQHAQRHITQMKNNEIEFLEVQ